MKNNNRLQSEYPKVGIRPTIDGRLNGVRESLEKQTYDMAKAAAELISDSLRYPNGEKVLPMEIEKSLTPLALAVWFMDDGFLRKSNSIAISTDKFSDNDLLHLCKSLEYIYEIKPSIVKSKKLYFGVNATKGFIGVIKPFIIPSMRYKIP